MLVLTANDATTISPRKSQTASYPTGLRFAVRTMGGRHTVHRLEFDRIGQLVRDDAILSLSREQDAEHAARAMSNQ